LAGDLDDVQLAYMVVPEEEISSVVHSYTRIPSILASILMWIYAEDTGLHL